MEKHTVRQCSQMLHNKQISAVELAQEYLAGIHRENPAINAFITLDEEKTLAEARAADQRLAEGSGSVLTGVPVAYKDLLCQEGWRTACASKMLDNFTAPYTATAVQHLLDAGAVTLGRTNMDEFAMGSTGESSFYGAARNPWNHAHSCGGSSSGSAAAVAARLVPAALGSDTGGSIRQPAAHCGITGIKPTYGTVSRFGMAAYASSFDQIGPMAQTAEDCALILNAIAGFDTRDSTSLQREKEDYTRDLNKEIKGLKFGLPREYFTGELDGEVSKNLQAAIDLLQKLGAQPVEISLPHSALSIPAYYVLTSAEAATNLARYDGVRYGYRTAHFGDLESLYCNTRAEGFGSEVKRRILIGNYVLSHGYYDAYYVQAQKLRRMIADDFQAAFAQCDIILAPAAPTAAPELGTVTHDPLKMYLSDIFTISLNLAGLPGMALPAGFTADRLPVGIQLIGNYFAEAQLLNIAHQMQCNSDWHERVPE